MGPKLAAILPYKWQSIMMQLEPYGLLLVFAAVYLDVFSSTERHGTTNFKVYCNACYCGRV